MWLVNVPPTTAANSEKRLAAEFAQALDGLALELPLALGVSGGSDSLAMLYLMADWAAARNISPTSMTALTVNHNLRAEAASEAKLVAMHAKRCGMAHVILEWEGANDGPRLQERARNARYDLMGNWCAVHDASCLLVAHTEDDQLETVGMRAVKGSGTRGLAGMQGERVLPNNVRVLRPLLSARRVDLQSFLRARGVEWVSDPSNADTKFERIQMRQALAGADEGVADSIKSVGEESSAARAAMDASVDDLLRDAVDAAPFAWARMAVGVFASAPESVRLGVLARLVQCYGGKTHGPKKASLAHLSEALGAPTFDTITLGGALFTRRGDQIWVGREARNLKPLHLVAGETALWDGRIEITAKVAAGLRVEALGPDRLAARGRAEREALSTEVPPCFQASLPVLVVPDGYWHLVPSAQAAEMADVRPKRP